MLKKLSALLALVLFAQVPACRSRVSHYTDVRSSNTAAPTVGLVFIGNEFSQYERKQIVAAIDTWNYVLNGYHRFEVQDSKIPVTDEQVYMAFLSGGFTVQRVYAGENDYLVDDENTGEKLKTLAWVNKIGGHKVWVVKDRVSRNDVYYVMLHEIGHILGARHVKNASLMTPKYEATQYSCIDKTTADQVAERLGAPQEELNHCYRNPPEKR